MQVSNTNQRVTGFVRRYTGISKVLIPCLEIYIPSKVISWKSLEFHPFPWKVSVTHHAKRVPWVKIFDTVCLADSGRV